jgi:hypothetical protein
MKTVFFTMTAICFINMHAFSQELKIGINAGTSVSNYKWKFDGTKISFKSKPGITGGIILDIPAGNHFSIQPALNFVQKGRKYKDEDMKETTNINVLELPLNLVYNSNGFFIGAGPSIAMGLSGKTKLTENGINTETKLQFGNDDDDDIKSTDIGANFLAGYRFKNGFLFSVNYNQGLNNLIPGDSEGSKVNSQYFGIKMGCFF